MLLPPTLSLAVLLLAGGANVPEPLKSGPQVGEGISGRFEPTWLNGETNRGNDCPV